MRRKLDRIERQVARTQTGPSATAADIEPVDPRTFVESPVYLNAKDVLYPAVLAALIELLMGGYSEAVLTGGIGVGKTTLALFAIAYHLYLLSCLADPQKAFGLATGSEIVFVFQSITAKLANHVDFMRFLQIIHNSPYFRERFYYDKFVVSELRFPHQIVVRPYCGLSTATLGQNIIGGVIDEVNYMALVPHSRQTPEGETYDQASELYNAISRRRKSRFMRNGKLHGLLCLVSSQRYPGQFTDVKMQEARQQLAKKGKSHIYVYDKRLWEIKPEGTFSGQTFFVFTGDLTRRPFIIEDGDPPSEEDNPRVIEVPLEFRDDFDRDIVAALRDIAGVATFAVHPFFMKTEAVAACFGTHESILSLNETDFVTPELCFDPRLFHRPELIRWVHLDLSLSIDATGIAIGCVTGFEKVQRGDHTETLPRIRIDCVLQVRPPKGGEIDYGMIRALLYELREHRLNIRNVSADSFQSQDTLQQLRLKGFCTGVQSVDTDPRPYAMLRTALYDGRVELPEHPALLKELVHLQRVPETGKVDHPPKGSKDLANALAGVVFGLTMWRENWVQHGVFPDEEAPAYLQAGGYSTE